MFESAGANRVLNRRHSGDIPAGAVYVGRGSPWGNPYKIGGGIDRAEAIRLYRRYVDERLARGELDISALIGLDLVCWCAPKACHADYLLELAAAAAE